MSDTLNIIYLMVNYLELLAYFLIATRRPAGWLLLMTVGIAYTIKVVFYLTQATDVPWFRAAQLPIYPIAIALCAYTFCAWWRITIQQQQLTKIARQGVADNQLLAANMLKAFGKDKQ